MIKKFIVFIFFSFIGIVYLHNLTRDIYSGDIGDLVTAAYVFGVAHPPGYPLFSLLGFIMSHLPIPLPVVSKVGLISVFSSLAGLIIYYKFCLKVSKSLFISLLSTSILAFSYLFWLTAEIPEGLGLNNFFVIVIMYLAIQFYEKKKAKDLYLLALFVGLSLTHQLFIITLFPAIFILIIKQYKYIFTKKRFLISLLCFLAGLAVYIYVPIAASRNPPINWDNAVNLKNFLHLILRKDYGGIIYGTNEISLAVRLINVSHYLNSIISNFSYQILFVLFLGFVKLFKVDKKIFFSVLIGFLLTGIITIFVNAGVIFSDIKWGVAERYYSTSATVLLFALPYGFLIIIDFLKSKFSKPLYSYLILSYFLIIPILLFQYNFPKTDLSKTNIGNNLAKNILNTLPKNSVLLLSGDTTTFNVWYAYYVLKIRPDISIINPSSVGNNIFLNQELNNYYKNNPNTKLSSIVNNTFEAIKNNKRMFIINEASSLPKNTILIPKGLVYEIVDKKNVPSEDEYLKEVDSIWEKIIIIRRKSLSLAEQNFLAAEFPFFYARGMFRTGDFLYTNYSDSKKATNYFLKAIWIDENFSQGYSSLAMSIYKESKDCNLSLQNIKQAIDLYPVWSQYYLQQYWLLKKCNVNSTELNKLKNNYKYRFNQDIDRLVK